MRRVARRLVPAGILASALLLTALDAPEAEAKRDPPEWVVEAAAAPIRFNTAHARAVRLLDEWSVVVDGDGVARRVERGAIRILSAEGRDDAVARCRYIVKSEVIKSFQAWLIRPSGDAESIGEDRIDDHDADRTSVVSEVRVRSVNASGDVQPGMIFAYEIRAEDRSWLKDLAWIFQAKIPIVRSRLTIRVEGGWSVRATTFHHDPIEPSRAGNEWTWEMTDLPGLPDEPMAPPDFAVGPWLAVSIMPPAGRTPKYARSFDQWESLASWLQELAEPQATADEAMRRKVEELTKGRAADRDRALAIAEYVQRVNYVSIALGLGRGGGYCPRPATEVFSTSYGDCKDKANLLRAMLQEAGIPSWLLLVCSEDPTYVQEAWPSAQQFDHCILAIRASDQDIGPIVDHPALGRVLLFDPTDPYTPFGDLPPDEQGGWALLVTDRTPALIRTPVLPADASGIERAIEATLNPDGAMTARAESRCIGHAARSARASYHTTSQRDYFAAIERWIGETTPEAHIDRIDPVDRPHEGRFDLTVEFDAPRYARALQNRLLVFRTSLLGAWDRISFDRATRTLPIRLERYAIRERTRFALPSGFAVDEVPDSVRLETSFASYSLRYERREGEIVASRELRLDRKTLPPSDYAAVRSFFDRVHGAEQAPVVLARE
ncbi:MAG TPA: DUF3857 domain-containing protein [Candidatus Eisenbacteria bacterium]